MDDSLEQDLRRALRPLDPGGAFTERVLARVRNNASMADEPLAAKPSHRRMTWLPAAIAASAVMLTIAAMVQQEIAARREAAAGARAKQELLEALRVTSEKLDLAYQAVENPTQQNPG
jgi:hypothetical protein